MPPIVGPGSAPGMMMPPPQVMGGVPPRLEAGMMGMHHPHGPRPMPGGPSTMQVQPLKSRLNAIIKDKQRICEM